MPELTREAGAAAPASAFSTGGAVDRAVIAAPSATPAFLLALTLSMGAHLGLIHGVRAGSFMGSPAAAQTASAPRHEPIQAALVSLTAIRPHHPSQEALQSAALAQPNPAESEVAAPETAQQASAHPALPEPAITPQEFPEIDLHAPESPWPSIPVPGLAAYYRAADLDERARPLNADAARIIYPHQAVFSRMVGRVVAEIYIGQDGVIHDVRILESDPPEIFDQPVIDAIRSLVFSPAKKQGQAVASIQRIEVPLDASRQDPMIPGSQIAGSPAPTTP